MSIELYESPDGQVSLEVRTDSETVWLSQLQISELFQTSRENITMHLRNVFDEGELDREATSKEFLQVRREGDRDVRRKVAHYNLEAIISVGYRVKSVVATRFRISAQRLRAAPVRRDRAALGHPATVGLRDGAKSRLHARPRGAVRQRSEPSSKSGLSFRNTSEFVAALADAVIDTHESLCNTVDFFVGHRSRYGLPQSRLVPLLLRGGARGVGVMVRIAAQAGERDH